MAAKRLFVFYCFFLAAAALLTARVWMLTTDPSLQQAAAQQQSYTLTLARQRPDFFDRSGNPLTGEGEQTLAVLFPGDVGAWNAASFLDEAGRQLLQQGMEGEMPFLVPLSEKPPAWVLPHTVTLRQRVSWDSLLCHLIGYLDGEGRGVTGLERALEPYLAENTSSLQLRVTINAMGGMVEGGGMEFLQQEQREGVRLSVDRDIQRAAEQIAAQSMKQGAVVVLDAETADILAWVSAPAFDRTRLAAELSRTDGALLNRVNLAYPAGSIYKIVVAAAALEQGVDAGWSYPCSGSVQVGEMHFQCNGAVAHGELDMEQALVCSCNCYFVALGQQIGAASILKMAQKLGLGSSPALCPGFSAAAGLLPTEQELGSAAQLALHCFGQGRLLVTPLQVAAMTRAVAMGGVFLPPRLLLQLGGELQPQQQGNEAVSLAAAAQLAGFLKSVVEQGTGRAGRPDGADAAAKTGTAQTGQKTEQGTEKLIGWYTGWFPAKQPRYVITVMMENVRYGSSDAGPVFAKLANAILALEGRQSQPSAGKEETEENEMQPPEENPQLSEGELPTEAADKLHETEAQQPSNEQPAEEAESQPPEASVPRREEAASPSPETDVLPADQPAKEAENLPPATGPPKTAGTA